MSKTTSQLTRNEKEELNALSKDVFGSSSRWQKLVDRGSMELVTEKVTEFVPAEISENEGTTREVQVPLKRKDGANQYAVKRHTVESIREYMVQRKTMLDQVRAEVKRLQDEAKAKEELIKKVGDELQGSAI